MKSLFTLLFLFLFLTTWVEASESKNPLELQSKYGKVVATCNSAETTSGKSSPHSVLWFFKQWHLAPSVDTRSIEKSQKLPQFENQNAIYQQLASWVERGNLVAVIAEGCEGPGELLHSDLKFNGWDLTALKEKVKSPDFDSILTNVPLKLAAKYGDKVHVYCGDDDELAKKHALAFSDARGDIGFLKRIQQYKDHPEQEKIYMDGVVETFHLSTRPTYDQAVKRLDDELKKAVSQADFYLQKRNAHLVEVIRHAMEKNPDGSNIAVVFGGSHAPGVKSLLEASGLQCKLVDPLGYNDDETQLFEKLKALISSSSQ